MQQNSVICSFEPDSPWLILSSIEQNIKRKIEAAGKPLKEWGVSIYRGILTGCNEAFIINTDKRNEILSSCQDDTERKRTEELIRPIIRGRDIKRYGYTWADLWLIATFPSRHYNIENYPAVKEYLLSFGKERLEQTGKKHAINGVEVKARKKTNNKWFETQDSIGYWEDFSKPKIAWGNLNTSAAYSLIPENYFINAPCVMISSGSTAILKFLNSRIADYYIKNLGVTRNGGYFEYKPMFVELLPLPNEYEEILAGASDISVDQVLIDFYHFTPEEVEVIMA